MTKKQMMKEIKFPVLVPKINRYNTMWESEPAENAWILCFCDTKGGTGHGLYKWQKKNNPTNITSWTYVKLDAATGELSLVPYRYCKDKKIIQVIDEKHKNYIIK